MLSSNVKTSFLLGGLFLGCVGVQAQETAPAVDTPPATAPESATVAPEGEETEEPGFKFGADLYYGISDKPGAKNFRDGFWLGLGPAYPANIYGRYTGKDGLAGKLSFGVGKLYTTNNDLYEQPIEAYISKPFGSTTLTAGKFYVPFELMEWQYQTAWGLQAERSFGKYNLIGSITHNDTTHEPNFHSRLSRELTEGVSLGLSLGGGAGFSFNTRHNKGVALDLVAERGRWKFDGVALAMEKDGAEDRFNFAHARVSYNEDRWSAYLSRHTWYDRADEQGNGNYTTLGGVYKVTKNLAVESAVSRSGGDTTNWIQAHFTFEN